jgi:hypothetical protein
VAHHTRDLPERPQIGIFNRSYYVEVLIVRVHPVILKGEDIAPADTRSDDIWQGRQKSIVDAESHLRRNGTIILKLCEAGRQALGGVEGDPKATVEIIRFVIGSRKGRPGP